MKLLIPTYSESKGQTRKKYPDPNTVGDEFLIFGSFKTFQGTEKVVNGVLTIESTAVVQTFYRPDIQSDCAVVLLETGAVYEIMNEPEDNDMNHQYLQFKVKRLKGGV